MAPNFIPDREHTYHVVTAKGEILHRCFSAHEADDWARTHRAIMWRTPILDMYPDFVVVDYSKG